jgi:WD40 repeat protein
MISIGTFDPSLEPPMLELTGHTGLITALAYTPDCRTLASASTDQTVRLWDLLTGSCVNVFQSPGTVVSLAFAPDGRELALGTHQAILAWDLDSGEMASYSLERGGSCTLVYIQGLSRFLVCASYMDKSIRILARDADAQLQAYPSFGGLSYGTLALASSPAKQLLAAGGGPGRGELCVWELMGYSQPVERHRISLPDAVYFLAFSPDAALLASAGRDRTIRLWDPTGGEEVAVLADPVPSTLWGRKRSPNPVPTIFGLAFTATGETLVSARSDGVICFWDVGSWQLRSEMNWQIGNVRTMVLAPDGMTAAVGGSNRSILVWDLEGV